jgi:uncharacterized membrane protein
MSAASAPSLTTPPPFVVASRAVAAASLLALIVLGVAWELWLAPTGRGTLALKVLPLAFCVVGVLKYRMKTYRWLSLLVWLYAAEGAVRATSDRGGGVPYAVAEVLLCLLLFGACAAHIRWRLRGAKPA